jgi:hypothetical protein
MNNAERAIEILRLTDDGDKLSPRQLHLESINVKVSPENIWDWDKYQPS